MWYCVYGGMQDYNYIAGDCLEITLELSEKKRPPESELEQMWLDNKNAMLDYAIASSFGGLK